MMRKLLRKMDGRGVAGVLAAVAAVIGGASLLSAGGVAPEAREKSAASAESAHDLAHMRNMTIFNHLVTALEENYVDSIRTDEAFEAAIAAMLSKVDPYTEYYSAGEQERVNALHTGAYGGIGAYITTIDSITVISQPIAGSPAQHAGLRPGDEILMIDSVRAVGMPSDKVSQRLKGVPGTPVRVTVRRPYASLYTPEQDSLQVFEIVREKVAQPSVVYSGVIDGHTGYVALRQFVDHSADEMRAALEALAANPAVDNVVIDLRGNGGGLIESAVEIAGFFLPKGTEVVRTRGKSAASERVYKTRHAPIMPDMPLSLLIDGGTASAAEILAGAMQDLDRGTLYGTRSYGKGLVQTTVPLPYSSMLKVTISKYYMPSGRLIQALDYSRRNADGSVARTPDSLTNVYHTRLGREVRDGGGLTPDSLVEYDEDAAIVYGLVVGRHIFNYATKYAATHPTIAAPEDFRISDADYDDFVASIDPATFRYDKICNTILDNLREAAKVEGYMDEDLTAAIDTLESKLDKDLKSELYAKRKNIERYLNPEIVSRYYGEGGQLRSSLTTDPILRKALYRVSGQGAAQLGNGN